MADADPYQVQRDAMVDRQIAAMGVGDAGVLAAMRKVPRHAFVPDWLRDAAYSDGPLPIGEGQTISQPYIVAYMTEALRLRGGEHVLEIGTGSGYAAAVLAEIAGDVVTVERLAELAAGARATLDRLGCRNIEVVVGDGTLGWPPAAPYDAIVVAAHHDSRARPEPPLRRKGAPRDPRFSLRAPRPCRASARGTARGRSPRSAGAASPASRRGAPPRRGSSRGSGATCCRPPPRTSSRRC